MAEMSRNAETTKIYSASLRVAILICDVEQAIIIGDFNGLLGGACSQEKAGIVKTRQKRETTKIVRFQPKVAAILNRGRPYMYMPYNNTYSTLLQLLYVLFQTQRTVQLAIQTTMNNTAARL